MMNRTQLAKSWIFTGILSLLISGVLSLVVTGAKLPVFKPYITDIEFIRWVLVIHVNLANLVWFTTIPVGLLLLIQQNLKPSLLNIQTKILTFSFLLAVVGIVLISTILPVEGVVPILSNYIPILTHPRHDLGLILYFTAVAISYFISIFFKSSKNSSEFPHINELSFGIKVGGAFFLTSFFTFIIAYLRISQEQFFDTKTFYEIGMWGGGHLLQHSNAVFLLIAWAYLLKLSGFTGGVLQKSNLNGVFGLMAIPLLIIPFIVFQDPMSVEYRDTFTQLMRWGMAPPMLYFIISALFLIKKNPLKATTSELTFLMSAWLLILGFIFGFCIVGSDLRIPGHYHATIGSVTLAFMVLSHRLFFKEHNDKKIRLTIFLYGIGQSLFATGMFTAGYFGILRKTYGAEHIIQNSGQQFGFILLAVGGLIALGGGFTYAISIIDSMRKFKRSS